MIMETKNNSIDKLAESLASFGIILLILYMLYEYIIIHFKPKSKYFIICWIITIGLFYSYYKMTEEKNRANHERYLDFKKSGSKLSEDEINDLFDKL